MTTLHFDFVSQPKPESYLYAHPHTATSIMHTRPEDLVAHDRKYILFVRLPTGRTVSLRNLGRIVTVAEIRDRLEIQAGLPCQMYQILPPGGKTLEEEDKLKFGQHLRNGAILKTKLHAHFELLFDAVQDSDVDADVLYSLIVGNDVKRRKMDALAVEEARLMLKEISNAERSFIMLYMAAHFGHHDICRILLLLDPEGPQRVTHFGRTALHAAAANDQLTVVQQLLHAGAALSPRDAFGKTPLAYCKQAGACACERLLKFKVLTTANMEQEKKQEPGELTVDEVCNKESKKKAKLHIKMLKDASGATQDVTQSALEPPLGTQWGNSSARSVQRAVSPQMSRTEVVLGQSNGDSHKALAKPSVCKKNHSDCYRRPTFVAVTKVPLEDQKLVTVEFTPMDRPMTAQSSVSRPKALLDKVVDKQTWAKKVVRPKVESYGGGGKARAQSAKYDKTKYHKQDEDTEYRERPATAGPRFRFWKSWMLEKLEQETIKGEVSKEDAERRKRNMAAYRRWLSHKERVDARMESEECSETSDEEENLGYGKWPSPRGQVFKKWLESKRSMIIRMTCRKRAEEEKAHKESLPSQHNDIHNRRLTVFEIGCADPTTIKRPPVEKYIMASKTWLAKKKRYEAWKKKNNVQIEGHDGPVTHSDIEAAKYAFFMKGMTYEEWMGMKHRESKLPK